MGNEIFENVVFHTELPEAPVRDELTRLLEKHGFAPETLTLEQLREAMAEYLQEVLLEQSQRFRS